jgi:hypothetical protein
MIKSLVASEVRCLLDCNGVVGSRPDFTTKGSRTASRSIRNFILLWFCSSVLTTPLLIADSITLTNGDKITCEIKKLENGKLTITVPYADDSELAIDWKLVSAVRSQARRKVHLEDGAVLTTTLQPAKDSTKLMLEGVAEPLPLSRITGVELEEEDRSWTDNLSSETDFNWGYTGADDFRTISLTTQNFYWGDKWEGALLGTENLNRTGGQPDSLNQFQGQLNVNRYLRGRFFVFPWAAGIHVSHAGVGYGSIWQLGGGAGWSLLKRRDNHLQFVGGIVALTETATLLITAEDQQQHSVAFSKRSPAFMMGTRWQKRSDEGMTWMIQAQYVRPTSTDMRNQLGVQATFSIPINGKLSTDVNIQDYTSVLSPGLLSTRGLTASTGLGLSF